MRRPALPGRRDRPVTLRCGRTVDGLWDLVSGEGAAETDPHVATCPFCRAELDGLRPLRAATDALVAEEVTAPSSLLDTVLRAVRTEWRRGEVLPLHGGPDAAEVSARAVAGLVRGAVDARDDLVPVTVQATAGSELGTVDVAVLAERTGPAVAGAGEVEGDLRVAVEEALRAALGLRLGSLRVQVRAQDGDPRS